MKNKIQIYIIALSLAVALLIPSVSYAQGGVHLWAIDEIDEALEEDLVTESVMVDYQADITREQFCELVVKVYEKLAETTAEVGDIAFSDTQNEEILKAAKLGIVNGYGNGVFAPNDLITREQIATMLVRMIEKAVPYADTGVYNNNTFNDSAMISDWALPSVNFAYDNNIMRGVDNNSIDPKANTTCEQAILLVYRVFDRYYNYTTIPEGAYELPRVEAPQKNN